MKLIDKYGRKITYLRVSVTDRCNLRCIYCRPNSFTMLSHDQILRYEEIIEIVKVATNLGIRKVRVTGGEPFVRKDIDVFLRELKKVSKIKELSITTNGVLLLEYIELLKKLGITRINISLDTLKPDRYKEITGRDEFFKVLGGIYKAKELGFDPIKINVVVLKGINEDEIMDFVRLSIKEPFYIRFIEYMPACSNASNNYLVSGRDIRKMIKEKFELLSLSSRFSLYPGPARYYKVKGAKGVIGFIDPMTSHFCKYCNRIRLTADGHLKPCLMSPYQIDIKGPIRRGADSKEIAKIFLKAVEQKPIAHTDYSIKGAMYLIGG